MTKASDNDFPSMLLTEGTTPSTPAASHDRLFVRSSDHLLCLVNSSGTVSVVGSGVAGTPAFVGAKAYNNTTQSITTGGAKLAFNVEDWDTNAFHDTVTNNSRFTVPSGKAGYYLCTCFIWAASASATYDAPFYVNGAITTSSQRGVSGAGQGRTFSDIFLLSVADYVEVNLTSDSTISYGHASARSAQLQMSVALLGT